MCACTPSAHFTQKVHSYEQIEASRAESGRGAPQVSQLAFI
jgi:hypothetical protein